MSKEFVERRDESFYLIGSRVPLAHIVREFQRGESPEAIRSHVIDALVLIWAASDAGEWENRVVEIPQP